MPDDHSGLVTDTALQGFTAEGLQAFNAQFHQLVDDRKLATVVTLIARRASSRLRASRRKPRRARRPSSHHAPHLLQARRVCWHRSRRRAHPNRRGR